MQWIINGTPALEQQSSYITIIFACLSCMLLMVLLLGIRLIVGRRRGFMFARDDAVLIIAAVSALAYGALAISQTRLGLGLPPSLRPRANVENYALQNFIARPFYNFATTLFKVAMCLTFLRLNDRCAPKWAKRCIWTALGLCALHGVGYLTAIIFNCRPVQKSWKPDVPGICLPIGPFYYGTGITTIIMDLILYTAPLPVIWGSDRQLNVKLVMSSFPLLGLFTLVCSIMRVYSTKWVLRDRDAANFIMWGVVEAHVGIILTLLPRLRTILLTKSSSGDKSRSDYPSHASTLRRTQNSTVAAQTSSLQRKESQDAILQGEEQDTEFAKAGDVILQTRHWQVKRGE
ncbi:hypothetical protein KVT40_002153 [Elsinoe batatas]|uniref:Rhodopsin domain-containing protein n=1 Tax=Elsinoe batatas TaxID=2601811 RepID=A0A8K0L8M4_9PEZI|nr:hypothetical protein KVT40_002153 [Elsinoe batatas]